MAHFRLRSGPVVAGLASAWLLVGCSEAEPQGDLCTGDECSEVDEPSAEARSSRWPFWPIRRDAGAKDAGAKDAGPKDAGPGPSADGGPHGGGHGSTSGLPCDVAAILEEHCGTCHGEQPAFGAPMALASAADFQVGHDGEKMLAHVKERINETDPRKAMPPASGKPLTKAQLATLNAWLDQGAPASDATCEGPTGPGGGDGIDTTGLECYRLVAHNGDLKAPYAVGVAKDAYFNFTFKAPWQGTVYGAVFRPVIDNKNVIHHWLLYQDTNPGKAGPAVKGSGAHPGGQLLAVWAPGGEPLDFRANGHEAAMELPGNTTYTMEYHYNSNDPAAKDASGVEICVQRTKPKNIAAVSWLGWDELNTPKAKWTGTCKPKGSARILAVMPHMHKTGVHMKGTINRANGKKEVLHDEAFDFNYQRSYRKDVSIGTGDTITTECTFSQPMKFGTGTEAEMCYLFAYAYPKGALADNGFYGRLAHGGGACLGQ